MAFVKILTGSEKAKKIQIDRDEIIMGRDSSNVVPLEDVAASGRHCAIVRDGRKFTLHDLDSTNGTRLNDVRITEYRLSPKDVITVGATQILFDGDDIEADELAMQEEQRSNVTVRIDTAMLNSDASAFHVKKHSVMSWAKLIMILGALAIIGAGVYFYSILKG